MKKLILLLALVFTPLWAEVTADEIAQTIPGKVLVLPKEAQPSLSDLNKTLIWLSSVGINPDSVRVADFDWVGVLVFSTVSPGVHQYQQVHVIFKSLKSNRLEAHSLDLMERYGTYPTAVGLINLTQKNSEDFSFRAAPRAKK